MGGKRVKGSGSQPYKGGDVVTDNLLIEEKPDLKLTKDGRDTLSKIRREAMERGKVPVLVMENFVLIPYFYFMELLGE